VYQQTHEGHVPAEKEKKTEASQRGTKRFREQATTQARERKGDDGVVTCCELIKWDHVEGERADITACMILHMHSSLCFHVNL
jgi:hypothetical protein